MVMRRRRETTLKKKTAAAAAAAAVAAAAGYRYKNEVMIHALIEGVADKIRVYVLADKSIVPVVTATVNMPVADNLSVDS